MRPNSDGRRLSKSAAGLDARVAVTCLVDARPSGWCQRRCIAGQSERVKDRHRDSDGGQRDNCHEDHEAGGCDEPTVFHALAVGQHAMDPRRRHNGHMLFLLRGVYSGRLLWAGARMLPPGFENSGLKVGVRNREAALRLTSNERLLDFFEDGSHKVPQSGAEHDYLSLRTGLDKVSHLTSHELDLGSLSACCSTCVKNGCS